MKLSSFLVLLAVIALLSGCAYAPAGFAPSIEPMGKADYQKSGHVSGKQTYLAIFGIFPLGRPDYNAAIRDALKDQPSGSTLVNVSAYNRLMFLYVVTVNTLTVEGDVARTDSR